MAEVRAPYLQLIVRQCRNMPDGAGERILARIPRAVLDRIQEASLADWLPFSFHQLLQDAKNAEVGEERAAEVTRTLVLVTLGTPLLGGFVTHVLQVLGADPRPAFQWAPRGYGMIFRGCGSLVTTVHPTRRVATIRLADMPPAVAASRSFVTSVGHALSTIYPITGFEGTSTLTSWDPERGTATFELTWNPPLDVR